MGRAAPDAGQRPARRLASSTVGLVSWLSITPGRVGKNRKHILGADYIIQEEDSIVQGYIGTIGTPRSWKGDPQVWERAVKPNRAGQNEIKGATWAQRYRSASSTPATRSASPPTVKEMSCAFVTLDELNLDCNMFSTF